MESVRIRNLIERVEAQSQAIILKHRLALGISPPHHHANIEYLFDRSFGRGRANFSAWPEPVTYQERSGYAGGIRPENIDQALAFVEQHSATKIWLHIESGVRDDDNWLDITKILTICDRAFPARRGYLADSQYCFTS